VLAVTAADAFDGIRVRRLHVRAVGHFFYVGEGWGLIRFRILWKSNTIYLFGTDSNCWQWTGSGWMKVANPI